MKASTLRVLHEPSKTDEQLVRQLSHAQKNEEHGSYRRFLGYRCVPCSTRPGCRNCSGREAGGGDECCLSICKCHRRIGSGPDVQIVA